jgi:tRNA dimethylallyltransferase
MKEQKPKIIVITGPTASGKSDCAVLVAEFLNRSLAGEKALTGAEILSADSRQVYKLLDVYSNKTTTEEMHGVPHHGLSIASPRRTFSVSQYQAYGRKVLRQMFRSHKLPIICGGTGYYIDSLLFESQFPEVKPNSELRKKLEKQSTEELFVQLQKLDPRRAETIDANNPHRLIRALEIVLSTGKPVPELVQNSPYEILMIGLKPSDEIIQEKLKKRIAKKLDAMIEEVKQLHEQEHISFAQFEKLGMGYRLLAQFIKGEISKEQLSEQIYREEWHYVRRQMTWFRRNKSIMWIEKPAEAIDLAEKFISKI